MSCDIEALFESVEVHSHGEQTSTYEEADGFENYADWLLNGCWPLKEQDHVIALTDDGFLIGQQALSHQIVDATAETSLLPKDSVLKVRPILEPKGQS